jgi:hypothetical protein
MQPDRTPSIPGFSVRCAKCQRSSLEDPKFVVKGLHPSEVVRFLQRFAEPLGWTFDMDSAGVVSVICPMCSGGAFDEKMGCPMCGHPVVGTLFCTGPDCRRGMEEKHLHRVCARCQYDFVQRVIEK